MGLMRACPLWGLLAVPPAAGPPLTELATFPCCLCPVLHITCRTRTCCPSSSRQRWSACGLVRTSCLASSWSRWDGAGGMGRGEWGVGVGEEGGLQHGHTLSWPASGMGSREAVQAGCVARCRLHPGLPGTHTPPRPAAQVLVSELGPDWEAKVASFDFQPMAAASIGQVRGPAQDSCAGLLASWHRTQRAQATGPFPHTHLPPPPPCRPAGALMRVARRAARRDEGAGAAEEQRGSPAWLLVVSVAAAGLEGAQPPTQLPSS